MKYMIKYYFLITYFCYIKADVKFVERRIIQKSNHEYDLYAVVLANAMPIAHWSINNIDLKFGKNGGYGEYTVHSPTDYGNNSYKLTLSVNTLNFSPWYRVVQLRINNKNYTIYEPPKLLFKVPDGILSRGDSVTYMWKAMVPIKSFKLNFPRQSHFIDLPSQELNYSSKIHFEGIGFQNGECGVTIFNINRNDVGVLNVHIRIQYLPENDPFTLQQEIIVDDYGLQESRINCASNNMCDIDGVILMKSEPTSYYWSIEDNRINSVVQNDGKKRYEMLPIEDGRGRYKFTLTVNASHYVHHNPLNITCTLHTNFGNYTVFYAPKLIYKVPADGVVSLGDSISYIWKTTVPIQSCKLRFSRQEHFINLTSQASNYSNKIKYVSERLHRGQVSITIYDINKNDEGNITLHIMLPSVKEPYVFVEKIMIGNGGNGGNAGNGAIGKDLFSAIIYCCLIILIFHLN